MEPPVSVRSALLAYIPAAFIGMALPASAEFTAPDEMSHAEAVAYIDEALASVIGVVHVRLDEVALSDGHHAALAYIELERHGYIQRKGDCGGGVCSFEETEIAIPFRPPAKATRIQREWISSCAGRDNCIEAVWIVVRYKVGHILGIKGQNGIAKADYVVEAHLTPIGQVLWPAMREKITSAQTARLERTEKGWKLLSLWMRQ